MKKLFISAVLALSLAASVSVQAAVTWGSPKDATQGQANGVQVMDAGDINGDGMADVAVLCGGMHANSSIFAWFEAPSTISGTWTRHNFGNDSQLRAFLGACILYDFDRDGDLDLCVTSDNHHGTNMQADLYIYINPGASNVTGSWNYVRVTPSTLALNHINDIAVDDMDKDGKPDIICRSLEPNQIHVFFQNSISSWTRKTISTGIEQSEGLAIGDIDRNGTPDIEYTGYWLKAPSAPRTSSYTKLKIDDTYKNTNQNTKEDLADIDGDGDLDLVLAPAEHFRDGANHILAWYANPGGTPGNTNWTRHTLATNMNDIGQVKLRDIDDDGDQDIVLGHCFVTPYYTKVYYNNGSGSFGTPQTVSSNRGLYTCGIIDFDGDGDLDISGNENYASGTRVYVYENLLYDGAPVTKYSLTVANGSGDGSYAAGASVAISANSAPAGQVFDQWTGSSAVSNIYASSTSLTMPPANTTVTATYKDAPVVVQTAYNGSAWSVPAKIEAEDYDLGGQSVAYYDNSSGNQPGNYRSDDVDIYPTTDAGNGWKVGYTADGEWLEYTVSAATGTYDLQFRVASPNSYGILGVSVDGISAGELTIPTTGAWDSFTTIELKDVALGGEQVLRVTFVKSGWDLNSFEVKAQSAPPVTYTLTVTNGSGDGSYTAGTSVNISADAAPAGKVFDKWTGSSAVVDVNDPTTSITMPAANTTVTAAYADVPAGQVAYNGSAWQAPCVIQGEDYDIGGNGVAYYDNSAGNKGGKYRLDEDVDIYATTDAGGGYKVGYTAGTEWVEYTVNAAAGTYNLLFRAATTKNGNTLGVHVDGTSIASMAVPNTGGWDNFVTLEVKDVALAGQHVIRVDILGDGWDLNWLEVEAAGAPPVTYALTVNNGSGDGSYVPGIIVAITADAAPAGQEFDAWTGAAVADANAAMTTITMPAAAVSVTATFKDVVDPDPDPDPGPTPDPGTNLALNRPATASSIEKAGVEPEKAVDGSGSTRWASARTDAEWLQVDLGQTYPLGSVILVWEAAYGRDYRIETSNDGSSWSTAYTRTNGTGGTDNLTLPDGTQGRYVRMQGVARGTGWGYSLYEFEVYPGDGGTTPPVTYALTVNNGSGDGNYTAGTVVPVVADAAPAGKIFDTWIGDGVADEYASVTTVTMPAAAVSLTATYKDMPAGGQVAYNGSAWQLPCRIQAEDYDIGGNGEAYYDISDGNRAHNYRDDEDVDIYPAGDEGGGWKVGYTAGDEWLEYTVNAVAGTYTLRFRTATIRTGNTLNVHVDGITVGTLAIPNTGGWDNFTTIELQDVELSTGIHVVRLDIFGSGWDLNWFEMDNGLLRPAAPSFNTAGITGAAQWLETVRVNNMVDGISVILETVTARHLNVSIHSLTGSLVTVLVDGTVSAGKSRFVGAVEPGVYVVRLATGSDVTARSIIVTE